MSYEADELRRSWKNCSCPIYASGTLGTGFRRKNTERTNWDEAKALALTWENADSWDGPANVTAPPTPALAPGAAVPAGGTPGITVADATESFIANRQNRGIEHSCGVFKDAVLSILATIAKQKRIRLSERTIAGLEKAKRAGRVGGRPRLVVNRAKVVTMDADGMTTREIGEELSISAASVCRILKEPCATVRHCRLANAVHLSRAAESSVSAPC